MRYRGSLAALWTAMRDCPDPSIYRAVKPDTSPFATSSSLRRSKQRGGLRAAPRFTSGVSLPRFLFINIRASSQEWPSDLNDHFFKASWVFIQHLALVLADHDGIGVSNASPVWVVDSWLATEGHTSLEDCFVAFGNPRSLMSF